MDEQESKRRALSKREILAALGEFHDDYEFLDLVNDVLFNYLKKHRKFKDQYNIRS